MNDRLQELRDQIEQLSHDLVVLLDQRFQVSQAIGEQKQELGLPSQDLSREDALIARLVASNRGTLPPEAIDAVFRAIFRTFVHYQEADADKRNE